MNLMTDEVAHESWSMNSRPIRPFLAAVTVGVVALGLGIAGRLINESFAGVAGALVAGIGVWIVAHRDRTLIERVEQNTLDRLNRLNAAHGSESKLDDSIGRSDDLDIADVLAVLEQRLELLGEVVQAFDSAVIVLDDQKHIVLANPAAEVLLATGPGALLGLDLRSVFTEAAVLALCERAKKDGSACEHIRMVGEDLARTFEGVALSILVSDRPRIMLMLRDVTELAQASALKTDFVGNASHELRTPIAAIRGATETLLGPARDDEQMRTRLVEMIQEHALRLEELVGDLLDLSRLESSEPIEYFDRVDLFSLCAKTRMVLEPMLTDRRVELSLELDEALHEICTSERAVRLVLRNLIDNAIKFSHEGGCVRVVGSAHGSPPETVRLEVIDHGVGIPLAQQPRIFERFYQVDDARSGSSASRGTGLGLSIVKHALRRIDGSIEVESVWNEGTTMRVEFPARAPTSARGA